MDIKGILKHLPYEVLKLLESEIKEIIEYKESYKTKPNEDENVEDFIIDFRKTLLLPKLSGTCRTATMVYFLREKDIYNPIINDLNGISLSEMSKIRNFGKNSKEQIMEIAKTAHLTLLP